MKALLLKHYCSTCDSCALKVKRMVVFVEVVIREYIFRYNSMAIHNKKFRNTYHSVQLAPWYSVNA